MDVKILLEINRIREIIGKELLIESIPPFNLLQQLFNIVGGSEDNLLSSVLKKSNDPYAKVLKNQIDLVSKELGQNSDELISKIQSDTLSPEEFDSLVSKLMKSDEYFYKRLRAIYINNSPPLRQIDDLIGELDKKGITPTADELGDLQLQLFKTVDTDPKLGKEVKDLMKERIAQRLSEIKISPKKMKSDFKPKPDPTWTENFKLNSETSEMLKWPNPMSYFQNIGRPFRQKTYENLEPFKKQDFDPKRIKWMNFDEMESVEGGEITKRKVARLVIDDVVPFLMYTSSGKSTPGLKKEGQWTIFSGWVLRPDGEIGWWIKGTEPQIKWTQGDSEFFTGLANYLAKNNINGLVRKIKI